MNEDARKLLERAAEFYDQSPDGQYDRVAAAAIRELLRQAQEAENFALGLLL